MTNQLGCYGSVLYHDADSRRCQACPFLDQCKIEVATNSIALRDWYESLVSNKDKATTKARKRAIQILAPEARVKRAASVPAVASTTTATKKQRDPGSLLSVKAQEFVDRWTGKSIDFEAYKSGVNPFVLSGNKFASVAMQFLMDRGSCTKMELTDYLIEHAGARGPWGMGTAGSHAGIVFDAFEHLGIITILEGKAHLVR